MRGFKTMKMKKELNKQRSLSNSNFKLNKALSV